MKKFCNYFKDCEYDLSQINETGDEIALNSGHNHFILVDDGSERRFGVEIAFRTALETFIQQDSVPMVLIVVEGGQGSNETVYNALLQKTPVILVKVTSF